MTISVEASLSPIVISELRTNMSRYENRLDFMYLDSVSVVTIGIGCALEKISSVDNINMFKLSTKASANSAEKRLAWNAVQGAGKIGSSNNYVATHFQGLTNLRISDNEIDRLFKNALNGFYADLVKIYPGFDSMPDDGKLAIFDMCYNLGSGGIQTKFPIFSRAIRSRDWKSAALQSKRPQLSSARNAYVAQKLLNCLGGTLSTAKPFSTRNNTSKNPSANRPTVLPPPVPFPAAPYKKRIPDELRLIKSAVMKLGDRGPDVRLLQHALNKIIIYHLPPLTLDGVFGLSTGQAVMSVQALAYLPPDGIVGPQTRRALDLTLA